MSDKTIDLHLKTLEEALASDEMDITEIDDEGSIPKLKFANRGAGTILILQGSIIKANKQDRAVKTTFVVHPHAVVEGDVFCIEASRWHSVRGQKGYKPDRNLSADICMDFSKSKSSQQDIWRKIEEKRRRMQVNSHSDSADFIYDAYQKELEEYKKSFVMKHEYAGVIALIEGKPIGLDISGIMGVFCRQFPDLISSFAIDALDKEYCQEIKKHKALTVEQFLREVAKTRKKERAAIGGHGIEMEGDGVVGGALIDHDVVVQLEAFASY